MFNFLRKKIGIIGYGNMGMAIAEGLKDKYAVRVFDKDKNKITALKGIIAVDILVDLVKQSEAIILAIKPQDFEPLLAEIKNNLQDKLVISIAAGITTEYMQRVLGQVRVVRVMPNLAVKVGQSTTSICKGAFATNRDIKFVVRLFKYLGKVFIFPEEMMDAATAIAGSGPGFWCDRVQDKPKDKWQNYSLEHFIPDLSLAAEGVGFEKKDAIALAISTTMGTLAMIRRSGESLEALKAKVVSKGGTTQAGLEALHNTGLIVDAVKAALLRSKELSKKE
ncbi:MAG: pyrroline-5-carboxylate reductase [Candidatus Omnitrophica bacterium]|nr:pyrroline-5-carboxylate reductase [Candidatus Omnitrophota bacterium]